ncbi:MAG: cytochrome c biogenesis protein CcsA [Myxococcota bacterium]|nr:cytochrome c biogenesis protein CcsA [Myxococcota bacterium]
MPTALLQLSALVYAIGTLAVVLHILRPSDSGAKRVMMLVVTSVIFHALAVGGRMVELSAFPLADAHDALSVFGFLLLSISLVVAFRGGVPQVAWLAMPLVSLMVLISSNLKSVAEAPESLKSIWLSAHIGMALLGDSAFVVAGITASVYLLQERRIRKRKRKKSKGKPGTRRTGDGWGSNTGMTQLPALEALDRVNVWLFKFGFPLMTLGIISGMVYGKVTSGDLWSWDTRNVVSAAVWVTYAAMLYARLIIGWRGRKAAWLTICCVIAILMTFIGLGVTGTTVHGQEVV